MGLKLGLCPFREEDWVPIQQDVARTEAYLHAKFHLDPSNRLATIHQHYGQTDIPGQNKIDRQTTVR